MCLDWGLSYFIHSMHTVWYLSGGYTKFSNNAEYRMWHQIFWSKPTHTWICRWILTRVPSRSDIEVVHSYWNMRLWKLTARTNLEEKFNGRPGRPVSRWPIQIIMLVSDSHCKNKAVRGTSLDRSESAQKQLVSVSVNVTVDCSEDFEAQEDKAVLWEQGKTKTGPQ